jgi:hypothetical protein
VGRAANRRPLGSFATNPFGANADQCALLLQERTTAGVVGLSAQCIVIDVNMEVGLCHPPVGLNLHVALIVTYWPALTLFMPRLLGMM